MTTIRRHILRLAPRRTANRKAQRMLEHADLREELRRPRPPKVRDGINRAMRKSYSISNYIEPTLRGVSVPYRRRFVITTIRFDRRSPRRVVDVDLDPDLPRPVDYTT